jgi:hypothetical protein
MDQLASSALAASIFLMLSDFREGYLSDLRRRESQSVAAVGRTTEPDFRMVLISAFLIQSSGKGF